MRVAFPLIALTLATGAAAELPAPGSQQSVIIPTPLQALSQPSQVPGSPVPCRDTIHAVRESRGLSGETVSPEPGQLIAAVDHRINGCSVMVMYGNTSDVRPLPAMPEGPPQLQRIPGR